MPLTVKAIENARPAPTDYELRDGRGLVLRVTAKGAKVFRYRLRSLGKVVTIGRWSMKPQPGCVTLEEARTWLGRLKTAHKAGTLAQVEAELEGALGRTPVPEPARGEKTFETIAKEWFLHLEKRGWRTAAEVKRAVTKDVIPALGARPMKGITGPEIAAVVKAVAGRGSETQAGRVLGYVKGIFRYARGHGLVTTNPADDLDPEALGVVENESERFLSAEEIAAFWHALDKSKMTGPTRAALRIVLLTGVRAGELLGATWDEIDFKAATWTIPVERQKMKPKMRAKAKPWTVPLTAPVVALFERLKAFAEGSPFVMASPLANGGEGGRYTDKALIAAMRKLFEGKAPLLDFAEPHPTPHDLRRTVRTHLGETLAVPPHVAERCLNHSLGKIARIYDRGDYLAERREALARWAGYVEKLTSPKAQARSG